MAARGLGKGLDALIPNVDTKGKSAERDTDEKKRTGYDCKNYKDRTQS